MAPEARSRGVPPSAVAPASESGLAPGALRNGAGDAPEGARRAGFGVTLGLTLALLLAAAGVLLGAVLTAVEPKALAGLGIAQRQSAETAVYALSFAVLLPGALVAGPHVANGIARGPNREGLPALVALLAAGLLGAVLVVRLAGPLSEGNGEALLLAVLLVWWSAAAAVLLRASRGRSWPALLAFAPRAELIWSVTALLALALPWTVVHDDSLSLLPLLLAAVALPAAVLVARRGPGIRTGRWGWALDVLAGALLLLVAIDLVIIEPEDPGATLEERLSFGVEQFHADFLLAPANQVLGGDAMLVDLASQYGVGSILFLAGLFKLVPIGYGTFGLLDGVLSGLYLVGGYALLRIAGCSRTLAVASLLVAVIALVLNRVYPVGTIVQEGPLRFGFPMGIALAAVVAARWPRHGGPARAVAFVIIGVASVWALEALALTVATWAALTAFEAYMRARGERASWLARQALLAALACACAHVLLALGTLIGAGQLPEWGQYLAYLDAFLLGELGDVTYDFSFWSPGILLGAAQLASAAALLLLIVRRSDLLARERVALTALVGATAYGSVFFMYLVDRSGDHVVPYVSLPALLAGTLWLSLLLRRRDRLPRRAPALALAAAASVALAMLAVAWSSIGERFGHTALAHAVPGVKSGRAALERLWDFPAIDGRAPEGERLLERRMPGERRSAVLAGPELSVEILMRSGRSNRIPWGDPWVVEQRLPGLRAAIGELQAGDLMLTTTAALRELERRRGQSLVEMQSSYGVGSSLSPLEVVALREITRRFRLEPVEQGSDGMLVLRLSPRA